MFHCRLIKFTHNDSVDALRLISNLSISKIKRKFISKCIHEIYQIDDVKGIPGKWAQIVNVQCPGPWFIKGLFVFHQDCKCFLPVLEGFDMYNKVLHFTGSCCGDIKTKPPADPCALSTSPLTGHKYAHSFAGFFCFVRYWITVRQGFKIVYCMLFVLRPWK